MLIVDICEQNKGDDFAHDNEGEHEQISIAAHAAADNVKDQAHDDRAKYISSLIEGIVNARVGSFVSAGG